MGRAGLFLLPILGFLFPAVQSLRFDLQSGHSKCIAEDIKSNTMSVGQYNIINPNEGHPLPDSHKVTVRVTSTYNNNYHFGENVESGQFAFTAAEAGDHMTCFWAPEHKPPITMTVDFEWKIGIAAKDWPDVANKEQLNVMEVELTKLEDTVESIHEEMFYLREREEEIQELNGKANSKMDWLTIFSLMVCLLVAGLQIWHLKSFFGRKKLL
ncbi:PREDICTED: transmembrane emp24 domain-containing protein p24delta9 [Nelumbo nucifera]|uniref:GOLD domain-containing protein n=2 Tax=Nelumbo nucifera TaxID=4432 RepID=A0A822YFY7_NELNU|nr:PREDICTED: transmembrane emp24 domain-containing protein p24delta9 [Nelumbo nucifera]DAD31332.1 TPA_asm: hypothetical protein HUJ06_010183 [Nelumbo nucifera]